MFGCATVVAERSSVSNGHLDSLPETKRRLLRARATERDLDEEDARIGRTRRIVGLGATARDDVRHLFDGALPRSALTLDGDRDRSAADHASRVELVDLGLDAEPREV